MHFLAQKVAEFIFFDFLCALMRRICFLFYLFLSAVSVWAYDFAEGGIYYAVTASDEVTVVAGEQHYEGYFEIPAEIRHEGVQSGRSPVACYLGIRRSLSIHGMFYDG